MHTYETIKRNAANIFGDRLTQVFIWTAARDKYVFIFRIHINDMVMCIIFKTIFTYKVKCIKKNKQRFKNKGKMYLCVEKNVNY